MTLRPLHYFYFALVLFLIDQASKTAIKKNLSAFDSIRVTPFLNLVYVENTGSAFGMFKSLGNVFFIAISIVAVLVISYLLFKELSNRWAYSLLLSGALGNMTDRIIYGYVIDFFDFHIGKYHWYVFNVADASLTVGMLLLLIGSFFPKFRLKRDY